VSPVGLLAISAVRLLIISDYNTTTASAIASSDGYVDTVLGTVIPLIPIILPYIALILLLFGRAALGVTAAIAAVFVSPMAVSRGAAYRIVMRDWRLVLDGHPLIITCLTLIMAAVFLFLWCGAFVALGSSYFMRIAATAICVALFPVVQQIYPSPFDTKPYTQLIREPWLPTEVITFKSGQQVVGYTLSDTPGWLVVLKNDDRQVEFYPAADVTGRTICELEPSRGMPPLIGFNLSGASGSSGTPLCDSASWRRGPLPPGAPGFDQ
jgi:hypothetical protein